MQKKGVYVNLKYNNINATQVDMIKTIKKIKNNRELDL